MKFLGFFTVVLDYVFRIISTAYLIIFLDDRSMPVEQNSVAIIHLLLEAGFQFRAFRNAWQAPLNLLAVDIAIAGIVYAITTGVGVVVPFSLAILLAIIGFFTRRIYVLWRRMTFMVTIFCSTYLQQKQRYPCRNLLNALQLIASPITFMVLVVGTIFTLPIFPLFGIPLFVLGFPRPFRTWSSFGASYMGSQDTIFYKTMLKSIVKEFTKMIKLSTLWQSVDSGQVYMLRSEYYIVWIEILERGLDFVRVNVKGLELQTTSCHAVEATRLDAHLENSYDNPNTNQKKFLFVNKQPYHTFEPVSECKADAYSVSDYQLTGIFDSIYTFSGLSKLFSMVLVFNILNTSREKLLSLKFKAALEKAPTDKRADTSWIEYLNTLKNLPVSEVLLDLCKFVGMCEDTIQKSATTPLEIHKIFFGEIPPPSSASDKEDMYSYSLKPISNDTNQTKMNWFDDNAELQQLFIKSFRTAVIMCMNSLIEEAEILEVGNGLEYFKTTHSKLEEMERDWLIACEKDSIDNQLAQDSTKKSIFILGEKSVNSSQYRARYLSKGNPIHFYVGKLNEEAVKAIWCELCHEMYYITNDDEERYSIQAHTILMRNIAIHAAEPPLGYPLYSSGTFII